MVFEGMNVEAVRQLSRDLKGQSAELEGICRRVDGLVARSQSGWRGQDAMQFASWWREQRRSQVVAVSQALAGLAQSASSNADEQERASGNAVGSPVTAGLSGGFDASQSTEWLKQVRSDTHLADAAAAGQAKVGDYTRIASEDDPFTGFSATAYRDSEGHVKVVFLGTDFKDPLQRDGTNDLVGARFITTQDRQAVAFARAVEGSLGAGDTLQFVGHSLGGRLAAEAAIATGHPATTFNADGLSSEALAWAKMGAPDDPLGFVVGEMQVLPWQAVDVAHALGGDPLAAHDADGLVTNIHTNNDILTNGQGLSRVQTVIGRQVEVSDPETSAASQMFAAHGLEAIRRGLGNYESASAQ